MIFSSNVFSFLLLTTFLCSSSYASDSREEEHQKVWKASSPNKKELTEKQIINTLKNLKIGEKEIHPWLNLLSTVPSDLIDSPTNEKVSFNTLGLWQAYENAQKRHLAPSLLLLKESFTNLLHKQLFNLNKHEWREGQFSYWLTLMKKNPSIIHLKLFQSNIDDAKVLSLKERLPHLQSLDLEENHVSDQGIKGWNHFSSLSILRLSKNKIKAGGAYNLTFIPNLTELDLYKNQIGDEGVKALAQHTSLTSLDLRENQITDLGAEALAPNTSLRILRLRYNSITDQGANYFLKNTHLQELELEKNQVSEQLLLALNNKLKDQSSQTVLSSLVPVNKEKDRQLLLDNLSFEIGEANIEQALRAEKSREAFLKKLMNFSRRLSDKEQEVLLDLLKAQKKIEAFYLHHFSMLTDAILAGFPLHNLRHLNLYNCSSLTSQSFKIIANQALPLESLIFGGHPTLKSIDDQGRALSFNSLKTFTITNCEKLLAILIKAPSLKHLTLSHCPVFDEENLEILLQNGPLKTLTLQECPHLKETYLRQLEPHYPLTLISLLTSTAEDKPVFTHLNMSKTINAYGFEALYRTLNMRPFITTLAFIQCQITDNVLKHFLNFAYVQELNLKGNWITDQGAKSIALHTVLTALNLKDNYIKSPGAISLAQTSALTSLNLANNFIRDKAAQALSLNKSLTFLNLSENPLTFKGTKLLTQTPNLITLKLSNVPLSEESFQKLSNNKNLTGLNMGQRRDKNYKAPSNIILREDTMLSFVKSRTLRALTFQGHPLTYKVFQALGEKPTLTSLNINNTKVKTQDIEILNQLSSLRKLEAADNYIESKDAQALLNIPSLTWLNLGNNKTENLKEEDLLINPKLKYLNLEKNQLSDISIPILLKFYPALTDLNLAGNGISEKGMISLAQSLTLTKLDVRGNDAGNRGAEAFEHTITLKFLNLRSNKIGDEGAKALSRNPSLYKLDVTTNGITNEGAQALAQNTSLKVLKIGNNKIGRRGLQALGKNKSWLKSHKGTRTAT